jgi:prolyl oligopeptidase
VRVEPAKVLVHSYPMALPEVPTRREDIRETLFGVEVKDPYRWLESDSDPEVTSWIERQNELLERTLDRLPGKPALEKRLTELLEIGSISLPHVKRSASGTLRLFYTRREGKQNHPILYVRDGLDGPERVLVDPNALGGDEHTTALDWYAPSEEGRYLAYGTSDHGTEDSVLKILDVEQGRELSDVIPQTRHASIAWLPGGRRFFYTRYPAPGSVPEGEERYHRKVYEHELGRRFADDPLVFGDGLDRTEFPNVNVSPDGRYLAVTVSRGWSESVVHLKDLRQPGSSFVRVSPEGKNLYSPLPLADALYVMTNEGAPRYRLFRVDPKAPARESWHELLPEHGQDVLSAFDVIGGELVVSYLHAGISRLERFDRSGKSKGAIPLPVVGASDGFSGLADDKTMFYAFESFAVPPAVRALDLGTGSDRLWQAVAAPIRADDFVVETAHAPSQDGTLVPYSLVRKKSLDATSGDNPTLLYGYGGFNINLLPRFSRSSYAFLERGGVYVQANARGGGELGESWHRGGQLENKQNTFDDFIAVAEDLIRRRLTRPERLAIHGRSNGGLLVAAAVTQRPELFRAAVAGVPLTDMVRYPQFLIAKLWVPEYGSPDDPAQFRALFAYSPYHRVRDDTDYPAVLVTTAESDTRVDPLHARKFVAALQRATRSGLPVLLRTERSAGHGAGMPVSKLVQEVTDIYAFLFDALGMNVK